MHEDSRTRRFIHSARSVGRRCNFTRYRHAVATAVNVHVVGRAFSGFVEYNKIVTDHATGEANAAATWSTNGTGTHGGDAGYILSAIAGYMDSFIDEYLRVNEDACRN